MVFCDSSPSHSVFMAAQALAANSICDLTVGTCVDQKQRLLGPHDVGGGGVGTTLVLIPPLHFFYVRKKHPVSALCIYWSFGFFPYRQTDLTLRKEGRAK